MGRGGKDGKPTSGWVLLGLGFLALSVLFASLGTVAVRTGYLHIIGASASASPAGGTTGHPAASRPTRTPTVPVTGPAASPATTALQAQVAAALAGTRSCAVVTNGTTPLVEDQPSAQLASASTQKLLLAAAALSALGPDYRFQTNVVSDAPAVGGTLSQAWLVGSGDPMLATPDYAAYLATRPRWKTAPVTDMTSLADQLAARGITAVPGGIHGDDTALSQQRYVPAWTPVDEAEGDISPVSALTVDEGWLTWIPAYHPVADPPAAAAGRLAGLMKAKGITSGGVPVPGLPGGSLLPAHPPRPAGKRPPPAPPGTPAMTTPPAGPTPPAEVAASDGPAPPGATVLASVTSAPLSQIVGFMLRSSDNVTAEILTRAVGLKVAGTATTQAGTAAVLQVDQGLGVPTAGVGLVDGSGLGAANLVTCSALLGALDLASKPGFEAIGQGLAVPGQSGTLASRFVGTPEQASLAAKTGSIHGVAAMVGTLNVSQPLHFALVVDGSFSYAGGTAVEDKVVAALAAYRGP